MERWSGEHHTTASPCFSVRAGAKAPVPVRPSPEKAVEGAAGESAEVHSPHLQTPRLLPTSIWPSEGHMGLLGDRAVRLDDGDRAAVDVEDAEERVLGALVADLEAPPLVRAVVAGVDDRGGAGCRGRARHVPHQREPGRQGEVEPTVRASGDSSRSLNCAA